MKRWIHFYSKEDFTKEETLLEIEDYSSHQEEKEKKDSNEQSRTQEHSRSLNNKRMRRVALTGRYFEKPQQIPYLWTNWLYR